MVDQRQFLAEAALRVLAEHGLRGLSHRAVDAEAGFPQGSTAAVFRSRQAIIDEVANRVADLEGEALHAGGATCEGLTDPAAVGQRIAQRCQMLVLPPMDRITRVRMELALHPDISANLVYGRFIDNFVALLVSLGVSEPRTTAYSVGDYVEGLMFHALTDPSRTFDTRGAARTITAIVSSAAGM